jgi:hypothetical protein
VTENLRIRCEACGFDGNQLDDASLISELRALGPRWQTLLIEAGTRVRDRPAPLVWSAIEYAAHTRDITALHVFGVEQALTGDEPKFPPIGDDLVDSAAAGYAELEPRGVGEEVAEQTALLAHVAEAAGADAWSAGITIGDERSDTRALLEHALHDSVHHLNDVENGLALLRK